MRRILIVEDDLDWLDLLALHFEKEGYEVFTANDGLEAYHVYRDKKPDIVVLDVIIPHFDGYSLIKKFHLHDPQLPVIFMSALTETKDAIAGYRLGAYHYFKKPFHVSELLACVDNLKPRSTYHFGSCMFNHKTRRLMVGNESYELNRMEADILQVLCQNLNTVVARPALISVLWGYDATETRTVDNHIPHLRKMLVVDPSVRIKTCYGEGYQLMVD